MKVIVYGTLRRGHGNNVLLSAAQYLETKELKGYKLYDSGFPVAHPDENSSVIVEVYDLGDNKAILDRLDRLEGEGYMYDRKKVDGCYMYIGNPKFWDFTRMTEVYSNNNVYEYLGFRTRANAN